ncbi:MAG: hypothetical protein ACREOO_06420 [bacterium]
MVDINLMGEDENSEDRQREPSFAKTVSLDDTLLKDDPPAFKETGAKPFQKQPPAPKFARKPSELYGDSSSRTKAYLIVLGLILAALTAVFFLIPRGPKKPPIIVQKDEPAVLQPEPTETPEESLSVPSGTEQPFATGEETTSGAETTTPGQSSVEQPSTQPGMAANQPPMTTATPPSSAAAMSPLERDLISSTWLSTQTVNALTNSFSAANGFTLITYYGNNSFLVEFLSPSAASTSELSGAIQRNVSPMQLKPVSESSVATEGGMRSTVVLSGKMDSQAGMAGLRGALNRMGANQFAEWIKQQGQTSGLALKRFSVGESTSGDNLGRIPMQVQFSGSRANVLSFLNTLGSSNFSVSVSKIIVSPSDRRTLSPDALDLVMHLGYVEM